MVLVFARPPRVRVTMANWTSRASVSGSRAAVLSPASRRRRARMPSDSRSMTSSDPSGRVSRVLAGTDFAPFLTLQHRCAPVAENRRNRSMEKNPRSERLTVPGCQRGFQLVSEGVLPVVVAADGGGGPPVRGGADQGDDAEHRVLPAGRRPERGGQLAVTVQPGGGAVEC